MHGKQVVVAWAIKGLLKFVFMGYTDLHCLCISGCAAERLDETRLR